MTIKTIPYAICDLPSAFSRLAYESLQSNAKRFRTGGVNSLHKAAMIDEIMERFSSDAAMNYPNSYPLGVKVSAVTRKPVKILLLGPLKTYDSAKACIHSVLSRIFEGAAESFRP